LLTVAIQLDYRRTALKFTRSAERSTRRYAAERRPTVCREPAGHSLLTLDVAALGVYCFIAGNSVWLENSRLNPFLRLVNRFHNHRGPWKVVYKLLIKISNGLVTRRRTFFIASPEAESNSARVSLLAAKGRLGSLQHSSLSLLGFLFLMPNSSQK
jgi:hypothetical protein